MSRDLRRRRRRPRCKQTSKNLSRVDRRRHSTSNPNAVKYGSFSLSPFSPNILPLYLSLSLPTLYILFTYQRLSVSHIFWFFSYGHVTTILMNHLNTIKYVGTSNLLIV